MSGESRGSRRPRDQAAGPGEVPRGPARDFAAYCAKELDRRRDSEQDFDPALYEEAVRLVLRKLGTSEEEGDGE